MYPDDVAVHPDVFRSTLRAVTAIIEYQVRQTTTGAAHAEWRPHNPKVAGSNPAPATNAKDLVREHLARSCRVALQPTATQRPSTDTDGAVVEVRANHAT